MSSSERAFGSDMTARSQTQLSKAAWGSHGRAVQLLRDEGSSAAGIVDNGHR